MKARRKRTEAKPPAGLRAVIAALQPDGYNTSFAPQQAAHHAAAGRAIHEAQLAGASDYEGVVSVFAVKEFDDRPASEVRANPELMAWAGFYVGVAACWSVMVDINGRGGAR